MRSAIMIRIGQYAILVFCVSVLNAQKKIDTLSIENYKIITQKISGELNEISSLAYYDNSFWGLNDSGGKPEIYRITEKTGKISQIVTLKNAKNIDWEELTFSNEFVFIGDFGNNDGNRKDLTIYYFPVSLLDSEKEKLGVEVEKIEFSYPEQKNFNPKKKKTNFDCEAMFYYDGKLHLFTKEWGNYATTHYTLEIKSGKQLAKRIESFDTNYMVTGASVDESPISNTHGFYFVGYTKDGFSFISGFTLPKKGSSLFFDPKLPKFSLPLGFTAVVGQTEGITIKPDKPSVICFSNEDFKVKNFHVQQSVQCIHSLAE